MRPMRLRILTALIGFLACGMVSFPQSADATTINFESLQSSGTAVAGYNFRNIGSFSFAGFDFSSTGATYGLSVWEAADLSHPQGGAPATSLFEYTAESVTTIKRSGEGTFTLTGIDFTQWGVDMPGGAGTFGVTIVGTKSDSSTVTQTVQVARNSGSPQLQSFTLTGFEGLTNVTMEQGTFSVGTAFQFNNLIVDDGESVPDSGSTLSLLSVAGICLAACRRFRA